MFSFYSKLLPVRNAANKKLQLTRVSNAGVSCCQGLPNYPVNFEHFHFVFTLDNWNIIFVKASNLWWM